ncbi:MAG: FAD-dependent oxidoreductase [Candidatus Caldarchaeum sp.]
MAQRPAFSRRSFIQGLAAGVVVGGVAVGAPLGILQRPEPVYWKPPEKWDMEADVVVVGFGVAGSAAAVEAADKGASVIVLDKSSTPGGNGVMSGGNIGVINSSIQKEKNLVSNPADWYKSVQALMKATHWEPPFPDRDMKYIENAGRDIGDWLAGLGVEYESVAATTLRTKGGGAGLVSALQKAAKNKGVRVETEMKAVQLVARPDTNMVLGVVAERAGQRVFIKTRRAVVLTTGGFAANKELLKYYSTTGYHSVPITSAVSSGDGILMALALGAAIVNTYHISGFPAIAKINARYRYRGISAIFVNEKGYRFCNEGDHFDILNEEIFLQPGSHAWLVTDSEQVKKSTGKGISTTFSDDLSQEVAQGIVIKADTLEALADAIKVNKQNFIKTVTTWNEWAAKDKRDLEFGRTDSPAFTFSPIKTPPFYAVELVPSVSETNGGVLADAESRVISVTGKPIPRLYAAGDVAAEGLVSHLGESIFFGRVAGRNAASEQPWT